MQKEWQTICRSLIWPTSATPCWVPYCVPFCVTSTSHFPAWRCPFLHSQRLPLAVQHQIRRSSVQIWIQWNTYGRSFKESQWSVAKADNCSWTTCSPPEVLGLRSQWRYQLSCSFHAHEWYIRYWLAHTDSSHCVFSPDENTCKKPSTNHIAHLSW